MALIGSIRKRTGLLIGVIAVAMLAFLLMDGLSSQSRMGGAGGQNVGKIGKHAIPVQEFDAKFNTYEERISLFNPQYQSDDAGRAQVRELVWNEIAADKLLEKHYKNMGLEVSAAELGDAIYGANVHPYAKNILVNPQTGQYDPQFAYAVIEGVENKTNTQTQDSTIITQLKFLIKETLLKEKYAALYNKANYVPDFLAKDALQNSTSTADIAYVYFPYTEISDDEVTVTDKELQQYLDENAESYEKEATKTLQLYTVPIIPSAEDTADALANMNDLLVDFKATNNDSMFVRKYSDNLYGLVYFKENQLTGDENASLYFEDEIGTFYEPTFANNAFTITKLTDRKLLPDSVKARHILLPQPKTMEELDSLQALADSLVELIENGADFAALAAAHSTDQSNANNGGELGYFTPGRMVQPFNDAAFYVYEEGDVFKVPTEFGLHIVHIQEANPTTPAVRLAKVTRKLKFSKQTEKNLLNVQNDFRQKHGTPAAFDEAANGEEYDIKTVEVTTNQLDIPGIGNAREIVRWAFKEKVGTISGFDINDQYIVAHIKSESDKGTQPLSAVKGEITQKVLNQKKAAIIKENITNTTYADINELAGATDKEVKTSLALSYAFPNLESGQEPAVVGTIFGLEDGELSEPIEGKFGVYVVKLNEKSLGSAEGNLVAQKRKLKVPFSFDAAIEELKDEAGVKDMRYLYY